MSKFIPIEVSDLEVPRLEKPMPVAVVLDCLRSAYNTGNVFRVAEALRVERIIACGYTPAPPHPKLAKTARGCDKLVPCTPAASGADAVRELKGEGYTVYAVETASDAVSIWDFQATFPAAFVLGNEALGIAPETLALCDAVVTLPRFGCKNSINVGNAAAVVLYAAARQWVARNRSAAC
jgi:23S rRNA (guanosine2251-2'-O)-methyltransferase